MKDIFEYSTQKEEICRSNDRIEPALYKELGVKRGLRDENGNGVIAGLTNISKITSFEMSNGEKKADLAKPSWVTKKSPIFCLWVKCPTKQHSMNSRDS